MSRDARVDAYVANAPDFARPILEHLRELTHRALPGAEEAIKWGMPHFLIKGKNVAGMAAFKAHCTFVIHGEGRQGDAMGQFGRLGTITDLPCEQELAGRLRAACERVGTRGSARKPGAARPTRPEIFMPDDFAALLDGSPAARATFESFAPSHRRDYLEWITEAKTPGTRSKRMEQALAWLAEGRKRHWMHENR